MGQINVESELKSLFIDTDTLKLDFKKPLKEAKNEVSIVFSSGFLFYKTFISSQDKPSCVFSPSCSEFAVEAFQKKGLITGWLMTFDRLSRCHGFVHPGHYHYDIDKKLFNDPIK
jgi:putative membrane protein insertion efficiency factor